jgi:hypothetical protein
VSKSLIGDLLKMTNDSSPAEIERQMVPYSMLGNVFTYPGNFIGVIDRRCVVHNRSLFSPARKTPCRRQFPLLFRNFFLKGICTMKDDDPSISAKQHLDDFKRALGEFLKGLIEPSIDTLPSGLPIPVEPDASRPEKGAESDKSG